MIIVKPMGGQTKIKVTGLYQWDQLKTLKFTDEYPPGTEVHFAIKGETVALVYLLENGAVRIPSVLLQRALPIMAWVHVGETTVLEIEMPVTERAMPSDYIGIEDDVQHSIEYRTIQLEQWQVEAIEQMSDRYTKAETDEKLKLKADANRVHTKLEVSTLLNEKADVSTVENGLNDRYTKDEADVLLDKKADVDTVENGLNDRYTKDEADVLLDEKATVTELTDGLDARYTKDETDGLLAGKANKQQEEWITPTLLNGWVEFDTARAVKYAKNDLSLVSVTGCVKGGTLNQPIFRLPVGYRPEQTIKFPAIMGNGEIGGITIDTLGNVTPQHGNVSQFYFGFIIFKAV